MKIYSRYRKWVSTILFPIRTTGSLAPTAVSARYLPFKEVSGGTSDRSTGSRYTIDRLRRHFPEVQVESMEGAAFFYACQMTGIEPLQLRAVSNYVEERNRENWEIQLAITSLDQAMRKVLGPFIAGI